MRNNSIWFDSPLPRLNPHLTPTHPPRNQLDIDQEQSNFIKPQQPSPDAVAFRFPQANPLSPWSSLISADPDKSHLSLPALFPAAQEEAIEQKLIYSEEEQEEDEEQQPVTPMRQCAESDEGEIHTTGRKSHFSHRARKPRPKDKGLRKLSQKAFQIVKEMRNATYKDVASRLVSEINEEDFDGDNREEQNIKRRVYDALNVLIALGVLRKDGRNVISEKDLKAVTIDDIGLEETEKLRQKIIAKQGTLASKMKQLREVEEKFHSINILLERNRAARHKKNTTIAFPFVGLILDSDEQEQTQHSTQQEFQIRTTSAIQPFGDIDSLKWLHQFSTPIDCFIGQVSSFL